MPGRSARLYSLTRACCKAPLACLRPFVSSQCVIATSLIRSPHCRVLSRVLWCGHGHEGLQHEPLFFIANQLHSGITGQFGTISQSRPAQIWRERESRLVAPKRLTGELVTGSGVQPSSGAYSPDLSRPIADQDGITGRSSAISHSISTQNRRGRGS